MILVHNHPGGDPAPSRPDIELTREIGRALATISVALHDHIIVGSGAPLSFRQQGLLSP